MHPAGVLAIVLWILIAASLVLAMIRLFDWHSKSLQQRAFKEVVEERGFTQQPGESVRAFVRRAQRVESRRPSPLPSKQRRPFAQPPLPRIREDNSGRRSR